MKQIKLLFLMLIGILVSINLSSCSNEDDEPEQIVNPDAIFIDGIAYEISDLDNLEVSVTEPGYPNTYTGSITIPSTVTINGKIFTVVSVDNDAFWGSTIESVNLPNTIKSIYGNAFRECDKLKKIDIPTSVEAISGTAFYKSGIESLTIPKNVMTIYDSAFGDCENLKTVVIEDSKEPLDNHIPGETSYWGEAIFGGCRIENLYIGRNFKNYLGLEYCEYDPVYGNVIHVIKEIIIGEYVTDATNLLAGITSPNSITCNGVTPPTLNNVNFSNQCYMTTKVYVPASALQAYKDNEGWGKFWNIEAIK